MNRGAIKRAVDFLAHEQQKTGGFLSISSPRRSDLRKGNLRKTTLFPSLILSCLGVVGDEMTDPLKRKIAGYLLTQKNNNWSFNYWERSSKETSELPYPDDLDDTFCALSAIYSYQPTLIPGKAMAAVAQILIQTEIAEGGPYKTWLVDTSAAKTWQDVDVVVNANIGYFLHLQDVELPNINQFVESRLMEGNLRSPYYPSQVIPAYFVSRWYRGKQVAGLKKILLTKPQNPLERALRISSLLRLGYPVSKLTADIQEIIDTQMADGSWAACAFCIDPDQDKTTYYAGASSLTVAFCLEALSLYERASMQPAEMDQNYTKITGKIRSVIKSLKHIELKQQTQIILDEILKNDTDQQIILLPWLVAKAAGVKVEPKTIQNLAAASLWGWMAYTTYDDFLDGDGNRLRLPSANLCLRNLTKTLQATLPSNTDFQKEVEAIMDRLDAANVWEIAHCRGVIDGSVLHVNTLPDYKNYWQLADRSLGHTIAGLGVLHASQNHTSLPALRNFFKHYLIARQLNDDAHDWEEDLRSGHVNAVGVEILSTWAKLPKKSLRKIDLDKESAVLKTIMWEDVIVKVCADIQKHTTLARRAAEQDANLDIITLDKLLRPLEASTKEALQKRNHAREFIASL